VDNKLVMMWKEMVVAEVAALIWHLSVATQNNSKISQSVKPDSATRFETGGFLIRTNNATYSTGDLR
jgi:hypothetical protein